MREISVGIITLQGNNYGATLQAVALNRVLRNIGYKAENIDYNDPSRVYRGLSMKQKIRNLTWLRFRSLLGGKKRDREFDSFRKKYLVLSSKKWDNPSSLKANPPEYDVYISGSDQVWNPDVINGDYSYLLDFVPEQKKKLSYASSFGKGVIIETERDTYSRLLSRYDQLSVRELLGIDLIKELTNREATIVLDPTLLLSAKEWLLLASDVIEKRPYILCYYMPGDKLVCNAIKHIAMAIARKENLHIVCIGLKEYNSLNPLIDFRADAGPAEFIRLVADAEYIITNSFHGSAFAVNFGKKLCVPINGQLHNRESRNTRVVDFLERIHYEDAMVTLDNNNTSSKLSFEKPSIDTETMLFKLRNESLEYLVSAIE